MTHNRASLRFRYTLLAFFLLLGLGIWILYAWLPADGATGDLGSFEAGGYRVQWLIEEREGGLRPGDLIVRAGGHTADEWLSGAPRGQEWHTGGVVTYEIVRNGQAMTLPIRLAPTSLRAVLARWGTQLITSLLILALSGLVLWKRPLEPASGPLTLFGVTVTVHLWSDAYNFQYATLPWFWSLWFQLFVEHLSFTVGYAAICHFALIFPHPHPLLVRFPRLVPAALYLSNPLVILAAMWLSPTPSLALNIGNQTSMVIMLLQVLLAIAAAVRTIRTARDPLSRAQMRWILWGVSVVFAILVPGYVIPVTLTGRSLIPNPVVMLFTVVIPYVYGIAIFRYRVLDIEIIINRTLVYGTLTILLGGFYLILVRLGTQIVQIALRSENDTLVVFIATLTIALAFAPLRRRVQSLIDHAFYRTKLDYERLLPQISEKLATSIIPEQLAILLNRDVPRRLHISWATLLVLNPAGEYFVPAGGDHPARLPADHPLTVYLYRFGQPLLRLQPPPDLPAAAQDFLDQQGIELSIPLIVGNEMVGLYNLGLKRSGDLYTRDEIRLLYLTSQQVAIAVENSRLYEKAQQEIAERKQAEERIKASLVEKEVLLKEIHHRVKNNLQVISSLLYLQSKQIGDARTLAMFEESQHRVRTMALVHEKLYQTQDLAQIDFAEYVQSLISYLVRSYSGTSSRIRLSVNVDTIFLDIDTAIPCGLILNELVSNALKHAFPSDRTGEICVGFHADHDGQFTLTVWDDGVGMPADFDLQSTDSLGLQLVNTLVDQLAGTILLDTSHGTEFRITFARGVDR